MWFFETGKGTFCVRYFREGYGLFIDCDMLVWQKDAEAAARLVNERRTGHKPWDEGDSVAAPKDLSEWKTLEEIQGEQVKPTHDPIVVPLDCSCGHRITQSIARIRVLRKFRCPSCNNFIEVGDDLMNEIMEKAKRDYPKGLIQSLRN